MILIDWAVTIYEKCSLRVAGRNTSTFMLGTKSNSRYTCIPVGTEKLRNIKLERSNLSTVVYESLHEAIITLRLEPGQMVYETELATSLGVSRTPVREAFRILLSEDLIEIMPQKGARIAFISRKKVDEARFIRMSLEISGFREAARRWDSSLPRFQEADRTLQALLDEQERLSAARNHEGFFAADEQFHRSILEQIDNATLLNVISSMRAHLNRIRYLELKAAQHSTAIVEQHRELFASVRANREGETVKLLRKHIESLQYDFPYLLSNYSSYFQD